MFFYQFPIQCSSNPYPCYIMPQFQENNPGFYFDPQGNFRNNIIITAPSEVPIEDKNLNSHQCERLQAEKSSTFQNMDGDNQQSPTLKTTGEKKGRKNIVEEEFRPYAPEIKKGRKTPQNSNRNVVPNIMHQVISFMQKKNKSGKIVQKIIDSLQLKGVCSVKRFYLYQLLIKDKINYYVNADSLIVLKDLHQPTCSVYSEEEQLHYNKISRMLAEYFLKYEFESIILTSKRVCAEKRLDHLRIKRKILARISEMLD